jgi:hypothetical protein
MNTIVTHWKRSASHLHGQPLDREVERALSARFPRSKCPFHIEAIGGWQTYVIVRVTDGAGVNETAKAVPEEFFERGGAVAAVLSAAQEVVSKVQSTGVTDRFARWARIRGKSDKVPFARARRFRNPSGLNSGLPLSLPNTRCHAHPCDRIRT